MGSYFVPRSSDSSTRSFAGPLNSCTKCDTRSVLSYECTSMSQEGSSAVAAESVAAAALVAESPNTSRAPFRTSELLTADDANADDGDADGPAAPAGSPATWMKIVVGGSPGSA